MVWFADEITHIQIPIAEHKRMLKCLKACEGWEDPDKEIALLKKQISTDTSMMEGFEYTMKEQEDIIKELKAQKRVLVDALEELSEWGLSNTITDEVNFCGCEFQYAYDKLIIIARKALDKVKEEQ